MSALKKLSVLVGLTVAACLMLAVPSRSFAAPTKPAKVEKCDPKGKTCTKGKDCKVENCKKEEPKAVSPIASAKAGAAKKCDPKGKECKKGKDCKPENCKKAPPEPAPDDEGDGEDEGE